MLGAIGMINDDDTVDNNNTHDHEHEHENNTKGKTTTVCSINVKKDRTNR